MNREFPRIAEKTQAPRHFAVPRNGQPVANQSFTIPLMDYKNEIGKRIRAAREERGLTLSELSQRTGDVLTLKRINAYENGDRMPGPDEVAVLAKALNKRPAFLMALDDAQIGITPLEEKLIRNWRTLPERERMDFYRKLEALAMTYRDPVQDRIVERHLPKTPRVKKVTNATQKGRHPE